MITNKILTVSQITGFIKSVLEKEFDDLTVIGEISNFKAYPSGHWYFSLKEGDAVISCTMWKFKNSFVKFIPKDGMKIVVEGKISVYPPRGGYQIDVSSLSIAGEGELFVAFEKLKKKLAAEGLFEPDHKKAIPKMPMRIGIVTSSQAAALQDMIAAAKRRFPLTEIIIASCLVQGSEAPKAIANAIKELNTLINDEPICDIIIVGRGGGSIEDLWAFNDEIVARAIFDSEIPIVSGVGHETDFTIADFVADMRAPTPTAAMELITPDGRELVSFLKNFKLNYLSLISSSVKRYNKFIKDELKQLSGSLQKNLNSKMQRFDFGNYRFNENLKKYVLKKRNRLEFLKAKISLASPDLILKKGFVLVEKEGKYIKRASGLNLKDNIELRFYDGKIKGNIE